MWLCLLAEGPFGLLLIEHGLRYPLHRLGVHFHRRRHRSTSAALGTELPANRFEVAVARLVIAGAEVVRLVVAGLMAVDSAIGDATKSGCLRDGDEGSCFVVIWCGMIGSGVELGLRGQIHWLLGARQVLCLLSELLQYVKLSHWLTTFLALALLELAGNIAHRRRDWRHICLLSPRCHLSCPAFFPTLLSLLGHLGNRL